ncbi:hypothetical protein HYDPIDRAFT_26758 [Hydnomerulius pinastri MD-312]|nr:hypothetical protein HYDPIDRAFT_26758 [Hydnomerulius pinastri MD-312]
MQPQRFLRKVIFNHFPSIGQQSVFGTLSAVFSPSSETSLSSQTACHWIQGVLRLGRLGDLDFDFDPNHHSPGREPNQMPAVNKTCVPFETEKPSRASPSRSFNDDALIGGIVGGVTALLLLVATLGFLARRRRRRHPITPPSPEVLSYPLPVPQVVSHIPQETRLVPGGGDTQNPSMELLEEETIASGAVLQPDRRGSPAISSESRRRGLVLPDTEMDRILRAITARINPPEEGSPAPP